MDKKMTPEELKQMRIENLRKAREARSAKKAKQVEEDKIEKLETVKVPKSFIDELQKKMKEMENKQGMLEQIADKRQLAAYYARNQKKLPKIVSLRLWLDKVVVGWADMIINTMDTNPLTGAWVEKQTVQIFNEDGEKIILPYLTWIRGFKRVESTVLSTEKTDFNEILKVKRNDNGKIYNIDIRFVN